MHIGLVLVRLCLRRVLNRYADESGIVLLYGLFYMVCIKSHSDMALKSTVFLTSKRDLSMLHSLTRPCD